MDESLMLIKVFSKPISTSCGLLRSNHSVLCDFLAIGLVVKRHMVAVFMEKLDYAEKDFLGILT